MSLVRISSIGCFVFWILLWQPSCGNIVSAPEQELPAVIIASQEQIDTQRVLANKYIVMFKSLLGLNQAKFASYYDETQYFSGFVNAKYQFDSGVEDIRIISAVSLPSLHRRVSSPINSLSWQDAPGLAVGIITEVSFASAEIAEIYLKHWHQNGDIYFAEPNYISLTTDNHEEDEEEEPAQADDLGTVAVTYEGYEEGAFLWWHKKINLAKALRHIAEDEGKLFRSKQEIFNSERGPPIIAVFDSGIDHLHESLKDRMYVRPNGNIESPEFRDVFCGGDQYGCNTTISEKGRLGDGAAHPWGTKKAGEPCPTGKDEYGSCFHGTHVAGIIAADGKPSESRGETKVAGACPVCKILNIRVLAGIPDPKLSKKGGVTDGAILNGLKYIHELWTRHVNVRIINASIGKFHRSRAVSLLISNLKNLEENGGILVVGAAGNEDTMARTYPAALDDVLAVAATDSKGWKSQFSNFGMWVDIAAPGGGVDNKIMSTVPGNSYRSEAGTSMATPVVAGVAGLMLAVFDLPLSAIDLESALMVTSNFEKLYPVEEPNEKGKQGFNYQYYYTSLENTEDRIPLIGRGLVDAKAAVLYYTKNLEFRKIDEYRKHDRVDWSSCGTIHGDSTSKFSPLILLLLFPCLLLIGLTSFKNY